MRRLIVAFFPYRSLSDGCPEIKNLRFLTGIFFIKKTRGFSAWFWKCPMESGVGTGFLIINVYDAEARIPEYVGLKRMEKEGRNGVNRSFTVAFAGGK